MKNAEDTVNLKLTHEQLATVQIALEVYGRLRSGQIDYAFNCAFPEVNLDYCETTNINSFVRKIILPDKPILTVDNHGKYTDQYGLSYDQDGFRDTPVLHDETARKSRASACEFTGYKDKDVAFNIMCCIRQYGAVNANDGYFDFTSVAFDDANVCTNGTPSIVGFTKTKTFPIKSKHLTGKIKQHISNKNLDSAWKEVDNYFGDSIIRGSHSEIKYNDDTYRYELVVSKPRRPYAK